jgi:hypothetical protein
LGFTPGADSSTFTIGVSPLAHASYSGPDASAPAATRARTIASWLPRTARPSGVAPSCSAQSGHTIPSLREEQLSTSSILNMCHIVHTRQQARYVAHLCSHTHTPPPMKRMHPTVHVEGCSGSLRVQPSKASRSLRLHASTRPAAESSRPARPSHRHHITSQHNTHAHQSCTRRSPHLAHLTHLPACFPPTLHPLPPRLPTPARHSLHPHAPHTLPYTQGTHSTPQPLLHDAAPSHGLRPELSRTLVAAFTFT